VEKHVNAWQEVIHDIVYKRQLVSPGRIAYRLHRHSDYLSDICRRERVDPFAVANEILKEAQAIAGHHPEQMMEICSRIISLLFDGTRWFAQYVDPGMHHDTTYNRLCEQTGLLCEDLGGAIKALARVERDGTYNADDDPHIDECQAKIGQLVSRLQVLAVQLRERRAVRAQL